MTFVEMRDLLIAHFNEMTKDQSHIFNVLVDKDEMYNLYLDSFPAGTNEIFRVRREFDCSCCRGFIKNIGNAVVIKDNKVITIWDFKTDDDVFQPVLDKLSEYVKAHAVTDVYMSKEKKIGSHHNFEQIELVGQHRWDHFFLELPDKFVISNSRSKGDIQGEYRDTRNVFKRSLDEISLDAFDTVLDMINDNVLYRGAEWKNQLTSLRKLKVTYDKLDSDEKELFAWEQSVKLGAAIGRIRNHSIGTLLVNISEGIDIESAVKKYEQIVAPSNYKRPKAIFTKKMLEDAQKTVIELGYDKSLQRRFATLDDITINNILFSNKDAAKRIDGALDLFAELEKDVAVNVKKFDKSEEISIDDFIRNVVPTSTSIEALLENRLEKNMMSLIAPQNKDSKTMFQWNNNFSWSYAGNMTDSMKERVKAAGGNVDGVLRFSIEWNTDGNDNSDLDAHCIEPNRHVIFFGTDKKPYRSSLGGQLDVDIMTPGHNIAVENITYHSLKNMMDGTYKFFVNNYANRGSKGFSAEIEFNGTIYSFTYNKPLRHNENVDVAEVILKNGEFAIKEMLPSSTSSKEIWGLTSNQFVPVSVVCYSPNYWDDQNGIGHRHVFFMLKDCINPETPNAFYNEFLKPELNKHKRVFEALGAKSKIEDTDDQLSGIGFSTTKRDSLVVKVTNKDSEKTYKVMF